MDLVLEGGEFHCLFVARDLELVDIDEKTTDFVVLVSDSILK